MTGAAETLTAGASLRGQAQSIAHADAIVPETARASRPSEGRLFVNPSWLMPLPNFAAHTTPADHQSVATRSHAVSVNAINPPNALPGRSSAPAASERVAEPFGLLTTRAPQGMMWTKWLKVQHDTKAEGPALARCLTASSHCSQAAARFAAIIEDAASLQGRDRLELVNERVNAAIRYASDMKQWQRSDRWSAPLDRHHTGSFDTGMGDCEDYAIAKYVALQSAGTPVPDLRLVVVRDTTARTYHVVLAVRHDGAWLLLDNRWRRLIEDSQASFFTPLFALNAAGVESFTMTVNSMTHIRRMPKAPAPILFAGQPDTILGFD